MDIEAINFTLMLYSLICILLGALFTWISMKKNSSSKSRRGLTFQFMDKKSKVNQRMKKRYEKSLKNQLKERLN